MYLVDVRLCSCGVGNHSLDDRRNLSQNVDLLDEADVFEPIVLAAGEADEVKTRGFRQASK